MAKTLVCIIEEEAILSYLFVKELFEQGDNVLLISQQRFAYLAKRFASLFPNIKVDSIILAKDGDEDMWDIICRTIRAELSSEVEYAVNLSSGTRLMSIAVQQVFERFNSQFYFMPHDRNVIIHSQIDDNNENNDDIVHEIQHRVSIDEYFKVNDIKSSRHTTTQDAEFSEHLLQLYTQNLLSSNDFDTLDYLRRLNSNFISYNKVNGLSNFISYIGFTPSKEGGLTKEEAKYLTGGWFEEYILFAVKSIIPTDDIATGVVIQRRENTNHDINELDVVFTFNNRLFVIECKTGVGKASLYHEIVYKACALRESLLGIRSNAYIFSLNEDPKDILKITARNMDIVYCDRSYALQPSKMKDLFRC